MEARQTWPLSAAVLWVGYRTMSVIEQWFRRGEGHFLDGMSELERIDTADAAIAADEGSADPLPKAALLVALSKGAVRAWGTYEPRRSLNPHSLPDAPEVEEIEPETWQSHQLAPWYRLYMSWERARQAEEPFLLPTTFKWRNEWDHPEPAWRKVEIDRESLFAAFPPVAAAESRTERPDRPDWWASEDVTMTHWARRGGPAEDEARRRLIAGGDKPSDAAIRREMWRMWVGCGRGDKNRDVESGANSLKSLRAKG